MDFPMCISNLRDPTGVSNSLTFDNANACRCEFFPCVHDHFQKKLVRMKRSKEMQNFIESEIVGLNELNIAAETSFNLTNQFKRSDFFDNNDNEVFYTDKPVDNKHYSYHTEEEKRINAGRSKNAENCVADLVNNGDAKNRSKTRKDLPDTNGERSLVHGGSESSIPSFNCGSFDGIFASDRPLNVSNSFISDMQYCRRVKRQVKKQELGQHLKAKEKKEESSDSNSSDSDSDQSSSSSETTSSESSDSSCSSSSSSSSTSSSSESCDEDDSSSDSDSSDAEEDEGRKRHNKKEKKSR